jgi:hypothetical protein
MKRWIVLMLPAVFLLTGCGGSEKSAATAATTAAADAAVNADACRAFDRSLVLTRQAASTEPRAYLLAQVAAADEAPKLDQAAQLAYGETRQRIERTAAALRLWGARQQDGGQPGFDDTAELAAVRNAAALVIASCGRAGVAVDPV